MRQLRLLLVVLVALLLGVGSALAQEVSLQDWNLILVNADNPIPENYPLEFVTLSNGQKVDERIYPALQQMFDDMRAQGVYPRVVSGYRTWERQQQLMDQKIQDYINDGHSKAEAKELAEKWVAKPGASEHQLGIAVDINPNTERSTRDEVYGWLAKHAHEYGFIQRYTEEKQEITGIIPEPWHYRYVGKAAAQEITQMGVCLEEYIDLLRFMQQ